jgi:hypothetical protein
MTAFLFEVLLVEVSSDDERHTRILKVKRALYGNAAHMNEGPNKLYLLLPVKRAGI